MITAKSVLPPKLSHAEQDEWYFVLETKSGQQIEFGSIDVVSDEWIHLNPIDSAYQGPLPYDGPARKPYRVTERGIDIRLDAIAWVACGIS